MSINNIESIILTTARDDPHGRCSIEGPYRSPFHRAAHELAAKGFGEAFTEGTITVFLISQAGRDAAAPRH